MTNVIEADGFRSKDAGLHVTHLCAIDRDLFLIRDGHQCRNGRSDDIIRRNEDRIDLASEEALSHLLHIIHRVHRELDDFDAKRLASLFQTIGLNDGVDFTGIVNDTDFLCIRLDLMNECHLLIQRTSVVGPCDIAVRRFFRLHELRIFEISDRRTDDRDLVRRIRHRLRCRCRDRTDQVVVPGNEAIGDRA